MPTVDSHQMMRAACERDRERITSGLSGPSGPSGVSAFDASLGLMAAFGGERSWIQARRIAATVAWVRQSCERERQPAWLIELVAQRVRVAALLGDFPLMEAGDEQAMGDARMGEQRQMMPPMRANPFGNPPLGLDVFVGEHGLELMRVRRRTPSLGVVLYWPVAVVSVALAAVLFLLSHLNVR